MVRKAIPADLPVILDIYARARRFMAENGNPTQWGDRWPLAEVIEEDIGIGRLYVYEEDEAVHGVFAFLLEEEPCYATLEGTWRWEEPYGTIHRIAADGEVHGVLGKCLEWCRAQRDHLRIDTHDDNKVMRHLLDKYGFSFRGGIIIDDGTPRIAYDWHK